MTSTMRLSYSIPGLANDDDGEVNMFKQYKSLSQAFFTKYQEQTGISATTAQKPAPFVSSLLLR